MFNDASPASSPGQPVSETLLTPARLGSTLDDGPAIARPDGAEEPSVFTYSTKHGGGALRAAGRRACVDVTPQIGSTTVMAGNDLAVAPNFAGRQAPG